MQGAGDAFPFQLSRKEQLLSRPEVRWQEFRRSEEISAAALKWSDSHKLQLKKGCLDLSTQGVCFFVFFLVVILGFFMN